MPIIAIDIVGDAADATSAAAAALATRLGAALDAPAGSIWVTLRYVAASAYAENGCAPEPLPVFARVLSRIEEPGDLPQRAAHIAAAIAEVVGRPRHCVHVIFEPDARGRVFFGGSPDAR